MVRARSMAYPPKPRHFREVGDALSSWAHVPEIVTGQGWLTRGQR
jgi:hypothetical protein